MANHKSAAKRARQDLRRRSRNLMIKKAVRTEEKKLRLAIDSKNLDDAQKLLTLLASKFGKATQKGIYHANTMARKISRLSKQVHQISK